MQIIQSIKDRGAVVMAIFIAIALISFILMDSNSGTSRGGFGSTDLGDVNGKSISKELFDQKVKAEEAKQSQNGPISAAQSNQIREQIWNQLTSEAIFFAEAKKLGITLSPKELEDALYSDDQTNPLKQQGLVDAAGKLDVAKVADAIKNIKKATGEQRASVDEIIINPLKISTAVAKYTGMLNASAYAASWMAEKDIAENKDFATIQYVNIPYTEVSDSAVVVKDEDINAYVAKNKNTFKQEAGRTVSYVTFSMLPTLADSNNAKKEVLKFKEGFATDTNAKVFVARNTSAIDFKDEFTPIAKIQSTQKDSIIKAGVGKVYGPYVEGQNYALAKIIGTKTLPDSVKARHILIGTQDPKTGAQLKSDSAAKKLADSLLAVVKAGGNFAALAQQFSSDEGSKVKGGDLGTFGYGTMVPEFNEFCFSKTAGSKDVVKTQFGYHIIDVQNQFAFKPAYKIAYVARPIVASTETINDVTQKATKASLNKDGKSLGEYISKNGLNKIDLPTTIKENDYMAGSMQQARSLVAWVFKADKGQVSEPIQVGDDLVVATVNKVYSEGVQDAATARPIAEAIVRNQKKADVIVAKIGASMQTAAAAYAKQIQTAGADTSITLSSKIINGLGNEPKVIGAAFNKAFQTKESGPIVGTNGVYVIKVAGIQPKTPQTPEQIEAIKTGKLNSVRQQIGNWFEALRTAANIKDNRSKFF
jgi:peptidyl-prolyl cis-trans isomerase D